MAAPSTLLPHGLALSTDSLAAHSLRVASSSSAGTEGDSAMSTPLQSPSASAFLRTAATLEGLSRQLGDLKDDAATTDDEPRCCCGATGSSSGCAMWRERDRMEDKLKLSGEIGDALLQRYEALEKKHQREVEKFERQLEVKKTALAESVRRVNNLEKANGTHMAHFADVSKKNEALEKRYTQALHTQTLTQQSLTHVRAELTALRSRSQRQTADKLSVGEAADKIAEAERRYEEMRDQCEVEARAAKEESRKRKRADARVEELEAQLRARRTELEEVKEARTRDAQELLTNAKERLSILHTELSDTFRTESPAEAPEYQKTLEDLVASNALLKHDASELSLLLNDSRDEVRILKEEIDELRAAVGVAGRISPDNLPSSRRLASELMRSHNRTESSPNVGHAIERGSWARMSVHIPSSTRVMEHMRKTSLAPSFTSSSSYNDNMPSPGLGMGPIGEYGGVLVSEASGPMSPPPDGRESPKPIFRSSPSGGIGYVLNGVPKSKTTLPRPPVRRAGSSDRPRPIRTYSPNTVDAIAEWGTTDGAPSEEPQSPAGSEYSRAADISRKRRSILLSRVSTREEGELSPNASNTLVDQSIGGDLTSPMSEDPMSPHDPKRVHRRTLLLLTKSQGTQTDPVDFVIPPSTSASTATSPQPHADGSETSSLQEGRAGVLTALVEHLAKILAKLRSADIATLNKRLKKQHLPGDVSHLSRSTMRMLQNDVAEFRSAFKGVLDMQVNRREFTLLLKLLKDVFSELVELQAVVNDVTIDPSLAKKLQKEAYRDEDSEEAKQKGGLGWIAAPITKFFVTPAQEEADSAKQDRAGMPRMDRGKLQAGTIKAPKLQASTSATTTHVSVEFGGAGIVRRATPAGAPAVVDALPPSPDPSGAVPAAQAEPAPAGPSLMPPSRPSGTLRPQKSRANRNELLGIFAGASASSGRVSPSNNWVVIPPGPPSISPIPPRQLRAASSQYFGDRTIRARDAQDTASRKKLSSAVDAVIDRTAEQIDDQDPMTVGSYEPPLLERTLRPRGLSDSSIRSTFISHEVGVPGLVPAERHVLGSSVGEKKGYLESFASRFYPFRASPSEPVLGSTPTQPPDALPVGVPDVVVVRETPSPARPIPTSPRASKSSSSTSASSPTGSGSMAQSHSLLGMLASSITAAAEVNEEDEGEEDLRGARLRRGMSGMGRVGSAKTAWR